MRRATAFRNPENVARKRAKLHRHRCAAPLHTLLKPQQHNTASGRSLLRVFKPKRNLLWCLVSFITSLYSLQYRQIFMFAAKQTTTLLARRCLLQPSSAVSRLSTAAGHTASLRSLHVEVVPLHRTSGAVQTISSSLSLWSWGRHLVESAIWTMSSTMKKRRAKMNKHKLRKRRKLERRKSK